jgi:signal recognition particle GTPase
MRSFRRSLGLCSILFVSLSTSFTPKVTPSWSSLEQSKARVSSTELSMVFDFFKKRSEEGLEQLSKLSDAASRGKFGEGLSDAARYTSETNQAFADGLAKSRNRLLSNIESIFTGSEDPLEDLLDILLQADLGMATSEDIVAEVKSLREDSTKFLSKTDLMSVMRGKLIETLETENRAIKFADPDGDLPTVLFILGANGMGK